MLIGQRVSSGLALRIFGYALSQACRLLPDKASDFCPRILCVGKKAGCRKKER